MDILRVLQRPLSKCREFFVLLPSVDADVCRSRVKEKEGMKDFCSYESQAASQEISRHTYQLQCLD